MARVINFHGNRIVLPGVYTKIKSGINNAPRDLDYGKVLIIDTGSNAGFGGGAGINGDLSKDKDSLYEFNSVNEFRDFLKGGILWDIANPLFNPAIGSEGVSKVYFAKAATTTCATLDISTSTGLIKVKVKDEGLIGNGELVGGTGKTKDELAKGYGYKIRAGKKDTAKFIVQFYVGAFRGLDSNNVPYGEVTKESSKPNLILESEEVTNTDELVAWMDKSDSFKSMFYKESYGGTLTPLAVKATYTLAIGGTENYDSLDKVLTAIADLDYSFVLCDQFGVNAKNAMNGKILAHIKDPDTRFDKYMVVAAGNTKETFSTGDTSSMEIAKYYNDDSVVVVHGAPKKISNTGELLEKTSLHTAAYVLGRIAGLAPQIPITFKDLNIDGLTHNLTLNERREALQGGVLTVIRDDDFGKFIVEQGINSLQDNETIMTTKDESYSIQIKRIAAQLNKEILINAKLDLLNQANGVNRNTLTAKNVEDWVKGYLQRRVATENEDNLLLSYESVVTEVVGDAYNTTYGFVPNGEINKLFFTGFMLE